MGLNGSAVVYIIFCQKRKLVGGIKEFLGKPVEAVGVYSACTF